MDHRPAMKQLKTRKLQIRTNDAWLLKVKAAASKSDTTVSQFIRDAINDKIRAAGVAKAA